MQFIENRARLAEVGDTYPNDAGKLNMNRATASEVPRAEVCGEMTLAMAESGVELAGACEDRQLIWGC